MIDGGGGVGGRVGRVEAWVVGGVACESVYRFLLSPRWLGLALVMALAAAAMVALGLWQLDRYHLRSAINARIDGAGQPVPLASVLTPPPPDGVGAPPAAEHAWARVQVTGRYDQRHEILARARTVNGQVGFEVITPLVLDDGTAVLVDRGWLPPGGASAIAPPDVPAAPGGVVTVVGRIHAPESRAGSAEPFAGRTAVRRVSPQALASAVPHPLYGAYLTLETQTPPADAAFVPIPPDHENAAMNAGYVVQWWLFAALTLVGFGYLAVRERRSTEAANEPPLLSPAV
jgi:cytochrome oxidase assembly protein ShyY1